MKNVTIPTMTGLLLTIILFVWVPGLMANSCYPESYESFTISTAKDGDITFSVVKRDNRFPFRSTSNDQYYPCPEGFPTCIVYAYTGTGQVGNITTSQVKLPICCNGEADLLWDGSGSLSEASQDCTDKQNWFVNNCSSNTYKVAFDTQNNKDRFALYFAGNEEIAPSVGLIDMAIGVKQVPYYGTIIGPACADYCPKPAYSTDTITTTKWLNTGDPDKTVEVEYTYDQSTGCIVSILYRVNGGTWEPAEEITATIEAGDGSELLVECGDSEGNQYCRTCQFTTKRNPTCTYIRSGGRTMRICW